MVLWELTLATAYVLGLKRTYRIALRTQRRVISHKWPKLREFVYRRTRDIFSVAIKVHKGIQQRDISFGKSLGNRILRFLDRVRPQANIRGDRTTETSSGKTGGPRIGSGKKVTRADGSSDHGRPMHTISKSGAASAAENVNGQYSVGLSRTTVRSRITDGLGKFRRRSLVQSLPVAALGLWWQPVRRHMETRLSMASSGWRSLSTGRHLHTSASPKVPTMSFLSGHRADSLAGGLFREDIARLVYGGHGVSRRSSPIQIQSYGLLVGPHDVLPKNPQSQNRSFHASSW